MLETNKEKTVVFGIAILGLILMFILIGRFSGETTDDLLANKGFSICEIVSFRYESGAFGKTKTVLIYKFDFHGKTYNVTQYSSFCDYRTLIGKKFPLILDTLDPSFNIILSRPKDFELAKIPFPDSLQHIQHLCNCW